MTVRPISAPAADLRGSQHLRREAFAMSLYVSVVLLSALSVLSGTEPSQGTVFLLIVGTTIGMVLAHSFAVWVAGGIIPADVEDHGEVSTSDSLRVQLVGAGLVSALTILAVGGRRRRTSWLWRASPWP